MKVGLIYSTTTGRTKQTNSPQSTMLYALSFLVGQSSALTVAPGVQRSGVVSRAASPNMKVGLIYSTTTGNTETVAGYISAEIGVDAEDIADVEDITAYDGLIIGAPTWHTGADSERSGT